MEDVSRDTYQDRLKNVMTDTNRTTSFNIYLINKIQVTSLYNIIRRATDTLNKYRYTNEFMDKKNLRRDLATTLLINLLGGTLVEELDTELKPNILLVVTRMTTSEFPIQYSKLLLLHNSFLV